MTWIAGVDGCKGGWFRVCLNTKTRKLRFDVIRQVVELHKFFPSPSIIAIDIPIGLPDYKPRVCDQQARACLKERRNSVFSAPIRPALNAANQDEASAITESINGKRVSAQAYGIYPKIKSVDESLAQYQALRSVLSEVHPEVCFWAWNKNKPMQFAKKKQEGLSERVALIEEWLGGGVYEQARGTFRHRHVANDDIADAFAALWTAKRILTQDAQTLPEHPETDSTGLPMQIVY